QRAARADAALQPHAGPWPHVDVHVNALPPLALLAVLACERDEVVRRSPETRRLEIVQTGHGVPTATRQPWIGRRRDAERVEIRRADRAIVGDPEILVRTAEVRDVHRRAREQL